MKFSLRNVFACLAGLMALLVAGCVNVNVDGLESRPDTTRFYAMGIQENAQTGLISGTKTIGIQRIDVVAHLQSPLMAVRLSSHEYSYVSEHRWISSLDDAIGQRVEASLESGDGIAAVQLLPWPDGFQPDYRVALQIIECETDKSGSAHFAANWEVTQRGAVSTCYRGKTRYEAKGREGDYAGLAENLAKGADKLAADILEAVNDSTWQN